MAFDSGAKGSRLLEPMSERHLFPSDRLDLYEDYGHTRAYWLSAVPLRDALVIESVGVTEELRALSVKYRDRHVRVRLQSPPSLEGIGALDVDELWVTSNESVDVSPVSASRPRVRSITLNGLFHVKNPGAFLPSHALDTLAVPFSLVAATRSQVGVIRELVLLNYSAPDLIPVSHVAGVEALDINGAKSLTSFEGAQSITALKRLDVGPSPKLQLAETPILPTVETLGLTGAKRLGTLDFVASIPGVRNLELVDCGHLASVAPLAALDHLERLLIIGSTVIDDGDLSSLAQIPSLRKVGLARKRHYTPSSAWFGERYPDR